MNRLAFQTYGTKKLSLFQSVWNTTETSAVSITEQANITGTGTNWAPAGTNLVNGGYNHTTGSAAVLQFGLTPIQGQSYQMKYTVTGTGSVTINFGGVSSAPLFAGTDVIITMTPITTAALSITPLSTFVGNISLSIKQSSSAANQIQLPITVASGKSIWVDWGDGQYSTMNSANFYANRIHTYTASGEYPVRVFGDDFTFGFGPTNVNDRLKIKSISSWGKLRMGANSFNSCSNVTMSGITDIPNLIGVTSLSNVFSYCSLLTTVGRINEWNTSSVTNMSYMFSYCPLFNSNIGNWNTSAVTNMTSMFGSFNSSSNFNQDISGWNVSNVTNMNQMFDYATSFNQNLSNWERSGSSLSKVTNMEYMFRGASNFNNGSASGVANQLSWTINTTATSVLMNNMFQGASKFNSNLGTGTTPWNVSKVTTFANMFNGASNFNNGDDTAPINNWSINTTAASVLMNGMFANASNFNRDISSWNISKVTTTNSMFTGASVFNQPIGSWNTSNVTNMTAMFSNSPLFNSNIGNWNTSEVTNMDEMFDGAASFNQNLNNWERIGSSLSKVGNMSYMFRGATAFNNGFASGVANQLPWNTSNVTNMSSMFQSAIRLNSNLGTGTTPWDVSKVTTFASMFNGASNFTNGDDTAPINNWVINTTAASVNITLMFANASNFNRDISSWNISKVTTTTNMFNNADAFNQPLANWERVGSTTGNITNMQGMFQNTTAFNQNIGNWNVSKVTVFESMFQASGFNNNGSPDINNWSINTTLGANVNMKGLFSSAGSFNQPLNNWNTSEVINMNGMFQNATTFNQNIGNWNVSKVTNFSNFMLGKTNLNFSSTNLDAIYNGWIVNGVQPNTTSPLSTNISFGTAKYTSAGTTGKNILLAAPNNWIIQDGGI
jgi:surface protein